MNGSVGVGMPRGSARFNSQQRVSESTGEPQLPRIHQMIPSAERDTSAGLSANAAASVTVLSAAGTPNGQTNSLGPVENQPFSQRKNTAAALSIVTIELSKVGCLSCRFLSKEGHRRPRGGTGSKVVKQGLRGGRIG